MNRDNVVTGLIAGGVGQVILSIPFGSGALALAGVLTLLAAATIAALE